MCTAVEAHSPVKNCTKNRTPGHVLSRIHSIVLFKSGGLSKSVYLHGHVLSNSSLCLGCSAACTEHVTIFSIGSKFQRGFEYYEVTMLLLHFYICIHFTKRTKEEGRMERVGREQ